MSRGIQVPVTIGFDRHRAIGHMRVDADQLPGEGTYLFAIQGLVQTRAGLKTFELTEVSVLSDRDVQKYLDAKKGGK